MAIVHRNWAKMRVLLLLLLTGLLCQSFELGCFISKVYGIPTKQVLKGHMKIEGEVRPLCTLHIFIWRGGSSPLHTACISVQRDLESGGGSVELTGGGNKERRTLLYKRGRRGEPFCTREAGEENPSVQERQERRTLRYKRGRRDDRLKAFLLNKCKPKLSLSVQSDWAYCRDGS